jgi:hypothetical protein
MLESQGIAGQFDKAILRTASSARVPTQGRTNADVLKNIMGDGNINLQRFSPSVKRVFMDLMRQAAKYGESLETFQKETTFLGFIGGGINDADKEAIDILASAAEAEMNAGNTSEDLVKVNTVSKRLRKNPKLKSRPRGTSLGRPGGGGGTP